MSPLPPQSRSVRWVLALGAAALALPLLTPTLAPSLVFGQRFGGPSNQAATGRGAAKQEQTQQAPPASAQTGGQRGGQPRQTPPGFGEWWKDEAVKKEMRLTDTQVRGISRLYDQRSREMKPHSEEYEKQFQELEKMVRERIVDVPTYAIQLTRVEALRTELNKTRSVMLYSIYRMLTPEQYEKLREIRDRRRSGRGGGGPR